ncbi:hypothetical protein HDU99_004364, partial [Rhizoclosmatium hyalinum]
ITAGSTVASTTEGTTLTVPFWNSYDGYISIYPFTTSSPIVSASSTAGALGLQVPFKAGSCVTLPVKIDNIQSVNFVTNIGVKLFSDTACATQIGIVGAVGTNVATTALTQVQIPAAGSYSFITGATYSLFVNVAAPIKSGAVTLVGYYSDSACSNLVDYWLIGATALSSAPTSTCSSTAPYIKLAATSAVSEATTYTTTQWDSSNSWGGYATIISYTGSGCAASGLVSTATAAEGVIAPFIAGGSCIALSGTTSTIALGGASYKYTAANGFQLYSDNACATAITGYTTAALLIGSLPSCVASGSNSHWVSLTATKGAVSGTITSKSGVQYITSMMAGSAFLMAAAL